MFDVFSEEIEVLIKDGIANLYWYHGDLKKAWLRSGVSESICIEIANMRNNGSKLTKRQQMDILYDRLRLIEYNRRLEVSRNFVRILVEQNSFSAQDAKHRIEISERASLKLKVLLQKQEKDRECQDRARSGSDKQLLETYEAKISALAENFKAYEQLPSQKRGYALEQLFTQLMQVSGIPVEEPFRIVGEQLDGAIKYGGHYYLIELKWTESKTEPKDIGSFYYKIDGKLDGRGLMISINGFTKGAIESLPRGKGLKIILLDGVHFANVLFGQYTFQHLLEHALKEASLRANIYCPHTITPR